MSSLFQQKSLAHIPSIQHGHTYEAVAVREYVAVKKAESEPVVVKQCGLCLDTDFSFLGASPDRLVFDINQKEHGVVEVKCPFKNYHYSQEEACRDPDFFCREVGGIICLKTGHDHFYQVQGQLGITGLPWCDFVVWLGSGGIVCERILFNEELSSTTPTHCHISARSLLSHSVSRKPFLLPLPKHGRQIPVRHRTHAVAFHAH